MSRAALESGRQNTRAFSKRNRADGFRVLEMYTAIVLDGNPPMPQPHDARPSETVIMIVGVGLGVILPLIAALFVVLSALR